MWLRRWLRAAVAGEQPAAKIIAPRCRGAESSSRRVANRQAAKSPPSPSPSRSSPPSPSGTSPAWVGHSGAFRRARVGHPIRRDGCRRVRLRRIERIEWISCATRPQRWTLPPSEWPANSRKTPDDCSLPYYFPSCPVCQRKRGERRTPRFISHSRPAPCNSCVVVLFLRA